LNHKGEIPIVINLDELTRPGYATLSWVRIRVGSTGRFMVVGWSRQGRWASWFTVAGRQGREGRPHAENKKGSQLGWAK
jgi:hypothetical protein